MSALILIRISLFMERDLVSEAIKNAAFGGMCLTCGFLLGSWLFYAGAFFCVVAGGYLAAALAKGL